MVSAFVAKLKLGIDILRDSVSTTSKHEDMEDNESTSTQSDMDMAPESKLSVLDEKCRGIISYVTFIIRIAGMFSCLSDFLKICNYILIFFIN